MWQVERQTLETDPEYINGSPLVRFKRENNNIGYVKCTKLILDSDEDGNYLTFPYITSLELEDRKNFYSITIKPTLPEIYNSIIEFSKSLNLRNFKQLILPKDGQEFIIIVINKNDLNPDKLRNLIRYLDKIEPLMNAKGALYNFLKIPPKTTEEMEKRLLNLAKKGSFNKTFNLATKLFHNKYPETLLLNLSKYYAEVLQFEYAWAILNIIPETHPKYEEFAFAKLNLLNNEYNDIEPEELRELQKEQFALALASGKLGQEITDQLFYNLCGYKRGKYKIANIRGNATALTQIADRFQHLMQYSNSQIHEVRQPNALHNQEEPFIENLETAVDFNGQISHLSPRFQEIENGWQAKIVNQKDQNAGIVSPYLEFEFENSSYSHMLICQRLNEQGQFFDISVQDRKYFYYLNISPNFVEYENSIIDMARANNLRIFTYNPVGSTTQQKILIVIEKEHLNADALRNFIRNLDTLFPLNSIKNYIYAFLNITPKNNAEIEHDIYEFAQNNSYIESIRFAEDLKSHGYTDAFIILGNYYEETGKLEDAINVFNTIPQNHPRYKEVTFSKLKLLEKLHNITNELSEDSRNFLKQQFILAIQSQELGQSIADEIFHTLCGYTKKVERIENIQGNPVALLQIADEFYNLQGNRLTTAHTQFSFLNTQVIKEEAKTEVCKPSMTNFLT